MLRVIVVTTMLVLYATPGAAETPVAKAKALFKRAETHFSVGEFDKALDLYTEAYKTVQLTGFLFNIAQCHRYLGNCDKATFFYNRYLSLTPSSPFRDQIAVYIKACRPKEPRSTSAPATIPATTSAPSEPPRLVRNEEPPTTAPVVPRVDAVGRPSAGWLWTGAALSVALLVTGTVTGAVAYSKNQEYKEPGTLPARQEELKSSGQKLAVASVTTLGLGGAAAIATGLGYLLWYRPAARRAESPATVLLLDGGAGLVLRGSF